MRPTHVPGDVVAFIDHCVKKNFAGIDEVSDVLCAIVDFSKFNCYFSELWQAGGLGLLIVGGKEEAKACKMVVGIDVLHCGRS